MNDHSAPNTPACDPASGACPMPDADAANGQTAPAPEQALLYYCTDPVCSYCWAFEPVLNRLLLEYGQYFRLHTVMGGLLPSWAGFADSANGINAAADVSAHWREVAVRYGMPIDGSLWQSRPIQSSFPPAQVYLQLRQSAPAQAQRFLRLAREALMVFDRNIDEDAVLLDLLEAANVIDPAATLASALGEAGVRLMQQDIQLARRLGARGFPALIISRPDQQALHLAGAQPYAACVKALQSAFGQPLAAQPIPPLATLLQQQPRLFAQEIATLYALAPQEVESYCQQTLARDSYQLHRHGETFSIESRHNAV